LEGIWEKGTLTYWKGLIIGKGGPGRMAKVIDKLRGSSPFSRKV